MFPELSMAPPYSLLATEVVRAVPASAEEYPFVGVAPPG